jgi:hypothetical protein
MPVCVLAPQQRVLRAIDRRLQLGQGIGQSFYLLPDQAADCNARAAV